MKSYHFIFLFFILQVFIGCYNHSEETEKLNSILIKYEKVIPDEHHLYFVRSNFYCDGCIQSIFFQLDNALANSSSIPVTIISPDQRHISDRLLSKAKYINDSLRMADKAFSAYINLTIFETKNGKVLEYNNMGDSKKIDLPQFVNDFLREETIVD
tara:strand:- start:1606 stop:2073 length:468 start_codon:yes stop_codon:yes gene_type:complete